MGSCLEFFGLPVPQTCKIPKVPQVIQDEMFDTESQKHVAETKCLQLNIDQQDAFCKIMEAVNDINHPERIFFLNAPGGYGKNISH